MTHILVVVLSAILGHSTLDPAYVPPVGTLDTQEIHREHP